jgi:dolichyl-phosphate beta-glucosyltransferase
MLELSVIIPAYNEEKRITPTIESVFAYLSAHNISHEIIVVMDGSKDRTPEVLASLHARIPTMRAMDHKTNHGKGFAVRRGMLQATGRVCLFMDADNSTTIDNIEKMIPCLAEGYDVVIASIGVPGHQIAEGSEPGWRRLFGRMGNLFIRILAVPGIRDTQRGFKVFSAQATQDIFSHAQIDRFGFDIEVLALAQRFGYKIKELPINWQNDPNSHVSLSSYLQVFLDTIRIRWHLMTGVYPQK